MNRPAAGDGAAHSPADLMPAVTQVTAGNVVSRITGLGRVLAVGAALGATFLGDTYQASNLVSNILFELLAAGLLSSVLVPRFVSLLDAGRRDEAERFAGALLGLCLVGLGAVTLVAVLARSWILRGLTVAVAEPAVRAQEIRLGSFLLCFFLPQVVLYGVGAVTTAALHGDRRFAAAAFAPVANNLVVIATMGAFWFYATSLDLPPGLDLPGSLRLVLALGTTGGVLAMTLVPVVAARRAGLRLRPRWDPRHPELVGLARSGAWAVAYLALTQLLLATTLVLANRVEGGVVAYHIAFTFFLLPHAVLAHPVVTALYPRLASEAGAGRRGEVAESLARGLRLVAFMVLPASALLVALGRPALRLVEAGAFGGAGSALVAAVLAAYAPGLLGYAALHLLTRAFYALGDARTPTLVNLAVTGGGAALMAAGSAQASGGDRVVVLGLAHSVAMLAGAWVSWCLVTRRVGRAEPIGRGVARTAGWALVAGGLARLAAGGVDFGGRAGAALALLVGGSLAMVTYLAGQAATGGLPGELASFFTARSRRRPGPAPVPAGQPPPGDGPDDEEQGGPVPEGPVVAIVPAKDRADSVAPTVAALRGLDGVDEVLVVDDGSSDGTTEAALAAGARVLRLPENLGKGGAVAAGVAHAPDAVTYLLIDADVGDSAAAAGSLLEPVLEGRADLTVGVLPSPGGSGGFGLVRRLAAAGIRAATGSVPEAPLSGQRAVRGPLLRGLDLAPRFGLETALTVDALRAGARVLEVPVAMSHRATGRGPSGFAHRARQGADIVRALWPRLISPRIRIGLVAAALVVAVSASSWSGGRSQPASVPATGRPAKVLLVGLPGLGWDDVGTGTMPNLDAMVREGALAAMTVRTLGERPSLVDGYATLGAGARVKGVPEGGTAADAASPVEGGRAGDLLAGRTGWQGPEGSIAVLGAPDLIEANRGAHAASLPGALGSALNEAGRHTAVVGNAFVTESAGGVNGAGVNRHPPAVALMDRWGWIDAGTVSSRALLSPDPTAPSGVRADPGGVVSATRAALEAADVVLVDPGDLTRAAAASAPGSSSPATARRSALAHTDAVLGGLRAALPASTLVMVVSVVPPDQQWHLTPAVAWGAGVVHGYLHSPSTRRLGVVTLTDVAPTVLDALGVPVPAGMVGDALRYHPGSPDPQRLERLDRDATYRESVYPAVNVAFVIWQALVYLLCAGAVLRRGGPRRLAPALRALALGIAAFPLATFLFRAVPGGGDLGWWGPLVMVVIDAALVALAWRARRHPLAPLAWILGATLWVLVLDVVTGARLQTASIMGYVPHTAGRFYGIGNSTFAILAATSLLGAGLHLDYAPRRREALAAVAALLTFVLFVDGSPALGDDFGGILTLTPVFALTLLVFAGLRLSWRAVVAAAVVTLLVLGGFVVLDLARAPDARTHLGQFVADVWDHGPSGALTTMRRKADASLRLMRASVWTWAVPLIVALLLFLLAPPRRGASLLPAGSARRKAVIAALAAGLLGFAVNDSGVVVAALVLVYVGPLLMLAALTDQGGRPVLLEPAPAGLPRAPAPAGAPP